MIQSILLLCAIQISSGFNTLPPYIKPCSKSDNLNECGVKNGNEAMLKLIEGDPTYHIPSFNPLRLDYIGLEASNSLKLYITNSSMSGFDTIRIEAMDWDFDKKNIYTKIYMARFNSVGTYNLKGRLLVMNLEGSGALNNTATDNNIDINSKYETVEKNGKEYFHFTKIEVKIVPKLLRINFENLLNNPQISEQMNAFINENWQVFVEEIAPSVEQLISEILLSIINPICAKIPTDNIVKP